LKAPENRCFSPVNQSGEDIHSKQTDAAFVTKLTSISALLLTLTSTLLLGGCGGVTSFAFPGVYRLNIPQGNIITQDMVDQLRPGLTKRQVNFIMGTPLVKDTFDQDRWDYLYSFQPGGGERVQERLTLYFENNELTHFTGDFKQSPENDQFGTANSDGESSGQQGNDISAVNP